MTAPLVGYSRYVCTKGQIYIASEKRFFEQTLVEQFRNGYKQTAPFNVDTPYSFVEHRTLKGWGRDLPGGAWSKSNMVEATNKARAKFVGQLGDASSFGATLTAERKATWGTVVDGITHALLAAKYVSRGKLGKAAQTLGFHPPTKVTSIRRKSRGKTMTIKRESWVMPDGRQITKSAANNWLWYSYGIKPLVGDIYNGMDALTRPVPFQAVQGHGSAKSASTDIDSLWKLSAESSVSISAQVRVANPNLWLANQLGLINPVQWINEGIPFSFVIDWFSNLSQIINQMTDFVGLEIAKPITTSKHVGTYQRTYPEYGYLQSVTRSTYLDRAITIPSAKLRFAYERFQWQRGANAISLLVGLFIKNGPR